MTHERSSPDSESAHEAMIKIGELRDPVLEALRRMISEFGDEHYHTCPTDNDSGPCNCFAGALNSSVRSIFEKAVASSSAGNATSPIGQSDVEMLKHLADSMGFGRTHDMLRRVIAACPYLTNVAQPSPDGYRDAWLQMIAHCNEVKADRFRLEQTIRDSIEALERNSTSAPVVECLKAALPLSSTEGK